MKRRQLLLPLINKQIKNLVETISPGEFLFGPNLGEKIQGLKAMEKVGKDIRPSQLVFPGINLTPLLALRKRTEGGGNKQQQTATNPQLNKRRPAHQKREMRPYKGRASQQQRVPTQRRY